MLKNNFNTNFPRIDGKLNMQNYLPIAEYEESIEISLYAI
jgi:hypothetical protein